MKLHPLEKDGVEKILQMKAMPINATPRVWVLLAKYLVVINGRLVQKGWPQLSLYRLTGAILAYFVLAHEREIEEEFGRTQLANLKSRLPRFFSPAQIDTIAAASDTDLSTLPELLRIGEPRRSTKAKDARQGDVRKPGRRPKGSLL